MNFSHTSAFSPSNTFADVILPLPLPRPYTYKVPSEMQENILPGSRVVVSFGKKKILTAVVVRLHDQAPSVYEAKELMELLDDSPSVNNYQLQLFQWMADYYMCSVGEVIQAALPSGLKLSSESMIQLNPFFEREDADLNEREEMILQELKTRSLSYADVMKMTGLKNINTLLRNLINKEAILLFEEVKEKYSPKVIRKLRLRKELAEDKTALESVFAELEKKGKQSEVLLKYLQLVPVLQYKESNEKGLVKSEFVSEQISVSSVNTLVKNGILEEFDEIVSRIPLQTSSEKIPTLSSIQDEALQSILKQFEQKETVLLHGITGSGKTELYIHLIRKTIDSGSQVLMLLPEIALTTQIVARLQRVFGNEMGVYHSKYSDNERVETWKGILSGKFRFIVGVRSAIFLPFDHLGLVIIDEEHETSYKQYDPAPRYQARETALMLAHLHQAKTLLGSATPSIESYYNATEGKWGLVTLTQRYGSAQLPELHVIDLKQEKKKLRMRHEFSETLIENIGATLEKKEQLIVFQNRRGYAPYMSCEDCGHVVQCNNCSVSLTYHQSGRSLRCHYCGYTEPVVPMMCPACGSARVRTVGAGTERLEEDLSLFFPESHIQRMDLDTTRNKNSYQQIIHDFEERKTDILVGTQMVTKGLDFDHVSLVAIPDADSIIHFPSFRSHERAFHLITQVSGRAGRKDKKGKVMIQTHRPDHPLIGFILAGNYIDFYHAEKEERERFHYPPFTRLISISVKDKDRNLCHQAAKTLHQQLTQKLGSDRVLGPEAPLVERVRNYYLMDILIKMEKEKVSPSKVKKIIQEEILVLKSTDKFRNIFVTPDVDPA